MTSNGETVTLFDSTYQEAMALTIEAREFLAGLSQEPRSHEKPTDMLLASCETMRVTSRLTQVMAWLLVQQAVHAGEISRHEARKSKYRLAGHDVCEVTDLPFEGSLHPGLQDLLDRSHGLYLRVARLDSFYDE